MLTAPEIQDVAKDFSQEARARDYVKYILAPGFVDDPHAWELVVEVMEVVLHRRGLYIVPQSRIMASGE